MPDHRVAKCDTPFPGRRAVAVKVFWSLMLLGLLVLSGEVRADCTLTSTSKTAVPDMGLGLNYKDPAVVGGLYPNLSNQPPAAHLQAAMNAASFVRPLNISGQSDPANGRIVMISIGVSNTSQEFEVPPPPTAPPPAPKLPIIDKAHAFVARANADASKNPKLVIVNGAQGGTDIVDWSHDLSDPTDPNPDPYGAWATIDTRLSDAGVSPSQVQVVWIKHAHTNPQDFSSFPTTNGSDSIAYFQHREEQVVRNVKLRFPNAKLVFISSRTRAYKDLSSAGHGSREPYTYEAAFANRALIEQQIHYGSQPGTPLYYGNPDPAVNDGVAPVVLWGPYLWVDGLAARSDGVTWLCNAIDPFQDTTYPFTSAFLSDVRAWNGPGSGINDYDYKHPGGGGIRKVASQLIAFFKTRPYTAPWYLDTSKVLSAQSVTVSSGGVTSGVAPLTVQFTAAGSDPANVSPKIVQYAWEFDDGTSRLSDLYSWNLVNGGPPLGSFASVEVPHDSAAQNPLKTFSIPGTYKVRMTATDVAGNTATKSITITVTSPSPAAPTVSLASPEPGSIVIGAVAMRATATDFDGTIASVKFYADGALVGTGISVGGGVYTYSWTNPTPGAHDVVATATDNAGLTKTSFASTITVNVAPPNQAPAVAVTTPFAGAGFVAPANVVIEASASDSDGTVGSVSFHADGALLGAGTPIGGSIYRYTWVAAPQGAYNLTATATDDLGLSSTSAPIAINVYSPNANSPPSAAITAPAAGASFLTPAGVVLSAVASDAGGFVSGVSFYVDGVNVGAGVYAGSSAYTFAWTGGAAGAHSIIAVATDNAGLTGTSAAVAITISSPAAPPLQCTTFSDGNTLRTAVRQTISCNQTRLTTGPGGACVISAPPPCAGTIVADAAALAHGVNNPPAAAVDATVAGVKKQYDCQAEIAHAVYTFVGDKILYLTQGFTPADADAQLVTAFDSITTKCTNVAVAQDVSGVVLPQVGAPCSGYVGAVGSLVNPAGLQACLRATVEPWIRKIGNYKLPTVTLTAPAAGSSYTQPVNLALSATASDADGTVTQVAFYADGALLGTGANVAGTYGFVWSAAPAGAHTLAAVATDSDTLTSATPPIAVTVNGVFGNQAPTIALTAPLAGATFLVSSPIVLTASANDVDGLISSVDFYDGAVYLGPGQHLTGTTYQLTWSNAAIGTHALKAVATDSGNMTATSAVASIRVLKAPSVSITSPASGTPFTTPVNVTLVASASDVDGTVSSVQFYDGGVLLGSGAPSGGTFTYVWNGAPSGVHTVIAVATDSDGLTATAAPISLPISDPPQAPVVSITSPAAGAMFAAPASITIDASATSASSTIAVVGFYADGTYLGDGTYISGSTYRLVWSGAPVGTHQLTAVAIDETDRQTTTAPVAITVRAPPVVAMTGPAEGATFAAPATVSLVASASDADGTVSSVKFYADGVFVGAGTPSGGSFTYVWSNVPVGTRSVVAIATDSDLLTATSAARSFVVTGLNLEPSVSVTSPAVDALFTTPDAITILVSASDPEGALGAVAIEGDGASLGPVVDGGDGTFSAVWLGAAAGAHSLTATATDAAGVAVTSAPVAITVSAAPDAPLQCLTTVDSTAMMASVSTTIECNQSKLELGVNEPCSIVSPPACAGTVVADAATLSHGPNNPPAAAPNVDIGGLDKQLDCQAEIAKGVIDYIGEKVNYLVQGFTPADASALVWGSFDGVIEKCTGFTVMQDPTGVILPQVGPACESYVGGTGMSSIGAAIDVSGLATCLRDAADELVKRIGNYKLPAVTLTGPAANASFVSPASITLSATATDTDGVVSSVSFYADGALVGTGVLSGGTYAYVWNAPVGAHAIVAAATDSDSLTTTSIPIAISVLRANGAQAPAAVQPPAPGETLSLDFMAILVPSRVPAAPDADWAGSKLTTPGWSFGVSPPEPAWSAGSVSRRCTSRAELDAAWQSAAQALECDKSALGSGPGVACGATAPPRCAKAFVARTLALAFGPNDPPRASIDTMRPGLDVQLGCQAAIADAVSNYVGDRLAGGASDAVVEASAAGAFDAVVWACEGVHVVAESGILVPAVGSPCDAATGAAGEVVDVAELRACLHAQLASSVGQLAPRSASAFAGELQPGAERWK